MVMSDPAALGFTYLCLAFAALHLSTFLDPQSGTGTTTSAEAALLHSAAEILLPPLAALGFLFGGIALTYRHLTSRHLGAAVHAGNGRRSVSALGIFALCVSASTLELIVFGQAAGGGGGGGAGHGAQARALGLQPALRALPGAATVTFFCGMMLIVVAGAAHVQAGGTGAVAGDGRLLTNVAAGAAHVRAGGEAGGTGAVAGDGRILRLLNNVAAGAAAALVGLMVMAFVFHGPEH